MRPLTDTTPKPLLQVGGKPLIVWHLERLRGAGFTDIVINHAWLGAQLEARLGDGGAWGMRIAYSPEPEALETAGGIAQALPLLGSELFMVVNADVYCEYDYGRALTIAAQMRMTNALAWLVLAPNPSQHPAGDFALDAGTVRDDTQPRFTFSGIGLYDPALFAGVARGTKAKLAPLLRTAMATRQVGGELWFGRWEDVGTPERLAALDAELRAQRT